MLLSQYHVLTSHTHTTWVRIQPRSFIADSTATQVVAIKEKFGCCRSRKFPNM